MRLLLLSLVVLSTVASYANAANTTIPGKTTIVKGFHTKPILVNHKNLGFGENSPREIAKILNEDAVRRHAYKTRIIPASYLSALSDANGEQLATIGLLRESKPQIFERFLGSYRGDNLRKVIEELAPPGSSLFEHIPYLQKREDVDIEIGRWTPASLPSDELLSNTLKHAILQSREKLTAERQSGDGPKKVEIEQVRVANPTRAIYHARTSGQPATLREPFLQTGLSRPVGRRLAEGRDVLVESSSLSASTKSILGKRFSLRTFDGTSRFDALHLENLARLDEWRPKRETTRVFNFLPSSKEEIETIKVKGNVALWARGRDAISDAKAELSSREVGSTKKALLEALENGMDDTIIVVAHGDENQIYIPNGETIGVVDIIELGPLRVGQKRPVVIFMSCYAGRWDTGPAAAMETMATSLFLNGRATAVFAPVGEISASQRTFTEVSQFLKSTISKGVYAAVAELPVDWQGYAATDSIGSDYDGTKDARAVAILSERSK